MRTLARILGAGCLAAAAFAFTVADPAAASAQPAEKGKEAKAKEGKKKDEKGPKEKAGKGGPADLQKTFDVLTEAAVWARPADGKKGTPEQAEGGRYLEAATRIYSDALKAAEGDVPDAGAAKSAHDAARGVRHWLKATWAGTPAIPAPKPSRSDEPWSAALADLNRAKERLEGEGGSGEFAEAAKKAYASGRAAYQAGEFAKASEFARAADAWSLVVSAGPPRETEKLAAPREIPQGGPKAPAPPPALGERAAPPKG